jgi:16S rRNA (cytosine1402-N4)-methyltransferase
MEHTHIPVLLKEVVEMLNIKNSGVYLDGTVGLGGHAEDILRKGEKSTLIGIDRDEESLNKARERLKGFNAHLEQDTFSHMETVVRRLGYSEIDGILLDLGVSSFQLKSDGRGFSFSKDEPLDMRMDKKQELSAYNIVNEYPEENLANILWKYGEERFSRKIARAVVRARSKKTITTCTELSRVVEKAVGRHGRIHPATKTFQALRIEVNRELNELSSALTAGVTILKRGGRFCVISYHSLEDRIVKHSFREYAQEKVISLITKKPLTPSKEEQQRNPSSRSAKMRVAEKL